MINGPTATVLSYGILISDESLEIGILLYHSSKLLPFPLVWLGGCYSTPHNELSCLVSWMESEYESESETKVIKESFFKRSFTYQWNYMKITKVGDKNWWNNSYLSYELWCTAVHHLNMWWRQKRHWLFLDKSTSRDVLDIIKQLSVVSYEAIS